MQDASARKFWLYRVTFGESTFTYVLAFLDGVFVAGDFSDSDAGDKRRLAALERVYRDRAPVTSLPDGLKTISLLNLTVVSLDDQSLAIRGRNGRRKVTLRFPLRTPEIEHFVEQQLSPRAKRATRRITVGESIGVHVIAAVPFITFCSAWVYLLNSVSSGGYDDFRGKGAWTVPIIRWAVDSFGLWPLVWVALLPILGLIGWITYSYVTRKEISVLVMDDNS